jgi:hypothetical protein
MEGIQSNVSDVVVFVGEEFPEDVDAECRPAAICLDIEYCENRFVKDRVADILGGVRVGSDLDND